MELNMYEYRATVKKRSDVYDGDTITAEVDLGFHVQMTRMKFRLYGINTPELRGGTDETKAAARAARDRLRDLIVGKPIRIKTYPNTENLDKKGKYGRWLCKIYLMEGDVTDVNLQLVIEGHAVAATY
jgi:micrococcal nuclease